MNETGNSFPGWYPDVENPGGSRWWDGYSWTEYRQAKPATSLTFLTQKAASTPLWAPLYGATIGQAWQRFWRKYAVFTGRASRSEFWFAYLWSVIILGGILFILAFVNMINDIFNPYYYGSTIIEVTAILWLLGFLAVMIPFLAVMVRRLHDGGFSGTFALLLLVPFGGSLALMVLCALESRPDGQRYDPPMPYLQSPPQAHP